MPDTDLVVEILAEAPPASSDAAVTTEAAKSAPVEDLKAQFAELTKTSETRAAEARDAARQRDEAIQRERAARQEAEQTRTQLSESHVSQVDSALQAAKVEADSYQRDQQAAWEAGDFAKAAEIGRKMAKAEATISRLEEGKANLVEKRTEAPAKPTATQADPLEAAIANSTPRAAAWLKAHPTYITDPALSRKAAAAHNLAVIEGYIVDSEAYFDFCEEKLGLKPKPAAPADQQQTQPDVRTRSMPAAPVSHDERPSGGQSGGTKVTLTPGEQRAATDGTIVYNWNDPAGKFKKGEPIGLREMARRKMAMNAEGRYGVLSDS